MRADRLVAILLMLQRRDVVTAAEVADELEVSVRTARRDLEALSMAGVPVYPQRGRGGGWRLLGGGRLDLSGLTAGEARSLFLLVGGRPEATAEVRSALRKLLRALPEPLRQGAEAAAGSVVVDPSEWDRDRREPRRTGALDAVEAAVVDGERLRMEYRARSGEVTHRVVHPLGLAAKGRNWYLIAGTDAGLRTFRVDRVVGTEPTGEPVVRPEGFDLTEAWARITAGIDELRTPVEATGTATAASVPYLRRVFGRRVEVLPGASSDEVRMRLRGANVRMLANGLTGFGSWVRVEDPPELCAELARLGAELCSTYGGAGIDGNEGASQGGEKS